MRRVAKAVAVFGSSVAALGLAAGSALANEPAQHFIEDVTGDAIACESTTYTITSGVIKFAVHEGESRSGNANFTGTITPQQVIAEDPAGNDYNLRGAFWFGGTFNAQRESEQFTFTGKLQIVKNGVGTVDSVNVTFHVNVVDGEEINIKDFDFGTCDEPSE